MMGRILSITLLLISGSLLALPAQAGGWATITLVELPQDVPMGGPIEIEFVVRQHGQHPIAGLSPTVQAWQKGETITVHAEPSKNPGHYQATLLFPTPGEWTWQIEAFGMAAEMPTLMVSVPAEVLESPLGQLFLLLGFRPGERTTPDPGMYGRDLFVAKGCVTCHTHTAVPASWTNTIGRDLSTYDPNPEFLRVWLRNAQEFTSNRQWPMPTLELTDEEIDALIAFLSERTPH